MASLFIVSKRLAEAKVKFLIEHDKKKFKIVHYITIHWKNARYEHFW